jgi:DNA-binding transcriptional LysR family regulator
MDRLKSLNVFGKVVEHGGFSAAARAMNMSVTMVATHVQSLEDRLGVRLLNRTTRRVSLTETGRFYYERSSQILADLEEADLTAGALTSSPRGVLKIYSTIAVVRFILPVIDEFLALYPDVSLDLNSGERMVDPIEDSYDLAIRTIPSPDSGLISRKLTSWRHVLVCSPSYLDRYPEPAELADLTQHNCLRYSYYPHGDDWQFEDEKGERTQVRVAGSVLSNSAETLRYLASNGRALWLAPSFVVSEDLAAGRLVRVLTRYRGIEFAINAIYPNRNHLPTKVRLFIDLLAEGFSDHRKWMT